MINELPFMTGDFRHDAKAASELIGYVIVFSVIVATVILVTLTATPIIDNEQSEESARAVENSFLQIDKSVTTVQSGATNQFIEVEMPAGQLRQLDETQITFSQSATGDSITINTRPMQYTTKEGQTVVYNARFIASSPHADAGPNTHIRHLPTESHMTKNPVMRIPELKHPTGKSAYASSRARVVPFEINRTNNDQQARSEIFLDDPDNSGTTEPDENVEITITSEVPNAWEAYLNEHAAFTSVSHTDGTDTVTATVDFTALEGDRFIVTSHEIETVFGQRL